MPRSARSTGRSGRRILALCAVALLVVTACSDDDDTSADDDVAQVPEGTTGPDDTTDAATDDPPDDTAGDTAEPDDSAPTGETVEIHGIDFAFEGVPATVAAGTRISFVNDSESELHEVVAIRLPDDETRSVEELVQLPPQEFGPLFAGLTDVVVALPEATDVPGAVEGDGVLEDPGRYALICTIPTGADPQAYLEAAREAGGAPENFPGGPPHFVNGMFAEIVVQ